MTARAGGAPPLVSEIVPPPDPLAACRRLAGLRHRAWLDSAGTGGRLGRYSFLTADPWDVVSAAAADPLTALRGALGPAVAPPRPDLPPFQGGAIGYLAYEFGRRLERIPAPRGDEVPVPDVWLGLYDWVLAWDHAAGRAWIVSTGLPEAGARAAERARARLDQVRMALARPAPGSADAVASEPAGRVSAAAHPVPELGPDVGSVLSRAAYLDAVRRVRRYIFAGDVFQVNLTQRLVAPVADDALAFHGRLRHANPAPFAAYLEPGDWAIASASPERFLRVDADGGVETRPIKGTRPRGRDPDADEALGAELLASAKDRAENVMIVDLLRNDLSRVCRPGTVDVPELCVLERYATVQHLVSTVTGRLAPGRDALAALAAAFPGGSISGAPKLRAMEIIAELEPVARGVYCGTIGYWSVTGAMDTSIAIRTCVVRDGWAHFGVGGGVVADSDPDREYAESLDKARGIVMALRAPGEGR
jgi:para-aminobenzoate synthetase component 1